MMRSALYVILMPYLDHLYPDDQTGGSVEETARYCWGSIKPPSTRVLLPHHHLVLYIYRMIPSTNTNFIHDANENDTGLATYHMWWWARVHIPKIPDTRKCLFRGYWFRNRRADTGTHAHFQEGACIPLHIRTHPAPFSFQIVQHMLIYNRGKGVWCFLIASAGYAEWHILPEPIILHNKCKENV